MLKKYLSIYLKYQKYKTRAKIRPKLQKTNPFNPRNLNWDALTRTLNVGTFILPDKDYTNTYICHYNVKLSIVNHIDFHCTTGFRGDDKFCHTFFK